MPKRGGSAMRTLSNLAAVLLIAGCASAAPKAEFEKDVMPTSEGDLRITFIGHGTLMFEFDGKVIHVDPVGRYADYAKLPKADLILVTHEHGDHLDKSALAEIATEKTAIVLTEICRERLGRGDVMKNGDKRETAGLRIEAVPAYNVVHERSPGKPYHAKGVGNGYVLTFGDKRVYVAGDTENVAEMANLKNIDVAFLPMNLPYTMTPEMVAEAAKTIQPKILYPYHFGRTDTGKLVQLLKDTSEIEVRIRQMQ
jgi:L-ascorbate metabolism protein UlaG (beta-lactamase superfamily)